MKKIGEGYEADVYLVKFKNAPAIQKIFRVPDEAVSPSTKFSVWRQIEFDKFAKKYSEFFLNLQSYTFVYNCDYKKEQPKFLREKKEIKEWKELQKNSVCANFVYTPVLTGTLSELYNKLDPTFKLDRKTWMYNARAYKIRFQLLFQQLYILYLLQYSGWQHGDAHLNNWMYKKNTKILSLGKYKLKCPYQLFLCDYGLILHKDFELSPDETKKLKANKHRDIILNICDSTDDPLRYWAHKENVLMGKKLHDKLKRMPQAKVIKSADPDIFMMLFRMRHYREYWEASGLDLEKYNRYIIQFSDWEIRIYETLSQLIEEPTKILNYLYKLTG